MPAKTKKQRKLFGTALAMKRGEQPVTDTPAGQVAQTMAENKIAEYAKNPVGVGPSNHGRRGDLLRAGMEAHLIISSEPNAIVDINGLATKYKLNDEQKATLTKAVSAHQNGIARPPKTQIFDGVSYELSGTEPTPTKDIKKLQKWARFQKDMNGHNVKIVQVKGGYEAYLSTSKSNETTISSREAKTLAKGSSAIATEQKAIWGAGQEVTSILRSNPDAKVDFDRIAKKWNLSDQQKANFITKSKEYSDYLKRTQPKSALVPKGAKIVKVHDDGDLTIKHKGKIFVSTTDGKLFEEVKPKFQMKEGKAAQRGGMDLGAGVVRDRRGQHIRLD